MASVVAVVTSLNSAMTAWFTPPRKRHAAIIRAGDGTGASRCRPIELPSPKESTMNLSRETLLDDFSTMLSNAEDLLKRAGDRRRARQGSPRAGRGQAARRQAAAAGTGRRSDRSRTRRRARHRRLRARQPMVCDRRCRGRGLPGRHADKPALSDPTSCGCSVPRTFATEPTSSRRSSGITSCCWTASRSSITHRSTRRRTSCGR